MSNSQFFSSSNFLKIIKYQKILFFSVFALGSLLKSVFLIGLIKENFWLSDAFITVGTAGLSITYIISSLNKKGIFILTFNYLIAIFLMGTLFFYQNYPGGKTMLFLTIGIIPLLLFSLLLIKKTEKELLITVEELLWVVAILFVLIFYFVSRIVYLG
jgi:hypothetical protein